MAQISTERLNAMAERERIESLRVRLSYCHPPERVAAILHDRDPATNADLAAWRSLGR